MKRLISITLVAIVVLSTIVTAGERLSLGYLYGGSKSFTEIVEATNGSINVVSPTYFDISTSGKLEINNISETFINNMHEQNIKVTPFLSNHWGRKRAQAAIKNPATIIAQIVNAVEVYNLDGINVDLENLTPSDKDDLTNFVKLLREALPEEKTVSIAVASNPQRLTKTWVAAYDYAALAEHVDYLLLMAYDEHCYAGSEGPVASIGFVEESLEVILEQVSRDKVVLGIPLYGRFWKAGAAVGGEAIIMAQVPNIVKKYKLVPKYDEVAQTPFVKLTVPEGTEGPVVNGTALEPGVYTIYYENENSIKAKLKLVNEYDILGAGLWALDNEGADFWAYYKDALNEVPYETEKEVKIREKFEYAKQFIIDDPVRIEGILPYEIEHKVSVEVQKTLDEKAEYVELYDELGKATISRAVEVLVNTEKPTKQVKIKRYVIDKDNKLKVDEEHPYYTIEFVTAIPTKALVLVNT